MPILDLAAGSGSKPSSLPAKPGKTASSKGIKKIDIMAPATTHGLVERLRGNQTVARAFIDAGGSDFSYIMCLNDRDSHTST